MNLLEQILGYHPGLGTPGINPNAPDPRASVSPKPQNPMEKLFGNPFLLNLLAQSGYSTMPQSSIGAIGRAGVATQQQQMEGAMAEMQRKLIESQILKNQRPPYVNQSKPAASIQEYTLYSEQEKAAGREPISFEEYKTKFGGSQFITLPDGSVVQASRAFGSGGNSQSVVTPEQAAEATTSGEINKTKATEQADAIAALPGKQLVFEKARTEVARLRNHPGKSGSQGLKNAAYGFGISGSPVPGTPEADFKAIRDQAAGGAFLEAYQQLKGGGPITDREGAAALSAMTRMGDPNISEKEFDRALDDYLEALDAGFAKLEKTAKGDFSTEPKKAAPKKRYNPETGQIEVIE
jgi:hypothetical protein